MFPVLAGTESRAASKAKTVEEWGLLDVTPQRNTCVELTEKVEWTSRSPCGMDHVTRHVSGTFVSIVLMRTNQQVIFWSCPVPASPAMISPMHCMKEFSENVMLETDERYRLRSSSSIDPTEVILWRYGFEHLLALFLTKVSSGYDLCAMAGMGYPRFWFTTLRNHDLETCYSVILPSPVFERGLEPEPSLY